MSATNWREDANCRGMDVNLFFPARGAGQQVARAKAVCAACSVRVQCLDDAIADHERVGIWGGLTEKQRRVATRRRRSA